MARETKEVAAVACPPEAYHICGHGCDRRVVGQAKIIGRRGSGVRGVVLAVGARQPRQYTILNGARRNVPELVRSVVETGGKARSGEDRLGDGLGGAVEAGD